MRQAVSSGSQICKTFFIPRNQIPRVIASRPISLSSPSSSLLKNNHNALFGTQILSNTLSQKPNNFVKIVECGPREGVQSDKVGLFDTSTKIQMIRLLAQCGLKSIEVGSFVSRKSLPQMADSDQIVKEVSAWTGDLSPLKTNYSVLVPNLRGLHSAIAAGSKDVAVFTAVSDTFTNKNIGCSIEESMAQIESICQIAKQRDVRVRGYISCAFGCNFEGPISPQKVALLAQRLYGMGCYEISLGDTFGVGTVDLTRKLLDTIQFQATVPVSAIAVHFHNTNGLALANIEQSLKQGIRIVDSSVGGLGGCPKASHTTGNVATEHVVEMLHNLGFKTGINPRALLYVTQWIESLKRSQSSETTAAYQQRNPAFLVMFIVMLWILLDED